MNKFTFLIFSCLAFVALMFGVALFAAPSVAAVFAQNGVDLLFPLLPGLLLLGLFRWVWPAFRQTLRQLQRSYSKETGISGHFLPACFLAFLLLCVASGVQAQCVPGNTGGVVWRDIDSDGVQDASETLGVAGVIVNAYDGSGNLVGTATTNALGQYTLGNLAGGVFPIRVEISGLPAPYQLTFNGTDAGTEVQFIAASECDVDFGVGDPYEYCQANPRIALGCYGSGTGTGNTSAGVVSVTYGASGIPAVYGGTGENPTAAAQIQQVGAVWGSAYDRNTRRLYQSAFAKRHVGFGPGGASGVYVLDFASTGSYLGYFTLQGVTPANGGAALDLGSITRTSVAGTISAGAAGDNQLSDNPANPSRDINAFDKVGKVSYGNIDVYNNKLWLVNLNQLAIISVDLNNLANPVPTNGSAAASAITNQYLLSSLAGVPSCTNGTFRPFALTFYEGKGYLGGVCTGESGGTNANVVAYVLSFDPANVAAGFTLVESFNTNYNREPTYGFDVASQIGIGWRSWISSWGTPDEIFGLISYPQPIVSDIDFDASGNMILGMKDRFGDQAGYQNYIAVSGSTTINNIVSGGDIIHFCRNGSTWDIEGAGACTDSDPGISWKNEMNDGPSGTGEFYYNEHFGESSFVVHYETATGGLITLKSNNEVVATVYDPITGGGNTEFNTQGLHWYNTGNGAKTDAYRVTATGLGKGNGLGEPEAICNPAPLEIGNRVWMDTDNDGIQDPGESGIPDVTIQLYAADGTTLLGTTMTDPNGNWYFNNANVTDGNTALAGNQAGPQPKTTYVIRVDAADFPVGKSLSTNQNIGGAGQPDVRDNDAALNAGNAEIAVTTGNPGENNFTLDMAFIGPPCALTPADLTLSGFVFGPGVAPMQEIVTTNSGGNLLPESNVAGFYDATSSEGPLYTFCTEISQPVLPLQNPYTHEFNGTTNGFTAAVALRIAQVVQAAGFNSTTGFGAGNNTVVNFVALQLAVWNAIYDTDYSVSTGTFYSTTDNNGALATANGWLATAQTIAAPTVVVHNLYHPTGQNLLKVGNPPATVTAAVTPPTCTGAGAPDNGAITISGFTNQRYQYSSGTAFDAGAAIPVAITAIPVGGVIVSNLPNTSQNYTVRIYDAADDNCYVDQIVTVAAVTCPGAVCTSNEYVYLADAINNLMHKFRVNANGTLTEIPNGITNTIPWLPSSAGVMEPHGVVMDQNGNLYTSTYPNGDGSLYRLNCEGAIIGSNVEDLEAYNMAIVGDYIYSTAGEGQAGTTVRVHKLCDGVITQVGYVNILNQTDPYYGRWGMAYNPIDGLIYITDNFGTSAGTDGDVYAIDPGDPENPASVWQTHANIPPVVSGLSILFGITFDNSNNMYVVEQTSWLGPSRVRKYSFNGTNWVLSLTSALDATDNQSGYYNAWGIRYSATANKIYVTSRSEDCIAIFNPATLAYEGAAVPHVPGQDAKALDIVIEACYTGPSTINQAVCGNGTPILLRDLIGCEVCGGSWTRTSGTGGIYDACTQTFDASGATNSQFVFSGNTSLCGAFNVTVNVSIINPSGITTSQVAPTCTGATANNNGTISLTAATNGTHYGVSTLDAGSYDGPAFALATAIPALPAVIQSSVPNTGGTYIVRIFNGDNTCYTDETVTVAAVVCPPCTMTVTSATPTACVPATSTYSLDVVVTYTNAPGGNITVNTSNGGTVTVAAASSPQTITLTGLTADGVQDIDVTAFFVNDNTCTNTAIDAYDAPAACLCTDPVLSVSNPTICAGSAVDLTTLVTGNTPAGVLSFYVTQADAAAAVNALVNTTVAPAATTTYYVRSEVTGGCFSTQAIVITISAAPVFGVIPGAVCTDGSVDLHTLVTNADGGTLTFHSTKAGALAGIPTIGSTVSPASATNYYVRSTNVNGCYSVKEITISIKPVDCGIITITGPN